MSGINDADAVGHAGDISHQWKIEVMLPVYHQDVGHPGLDELISQEVHIAARKFASSKEADREPTWPLYKDFYRILVDVTDFDKQRRTLAESYCRRFDNHLSRSLGFPLGLEFKKLLNRSAVGISERILASLPLRSAVKLHGLSEATGHDKLRQLLTKGLSSGLMYDGDTQVLLELPVHAWDENELSILIEAFADPNIRDPTIDDIVIDECMHADAEGAFHSAVDWDWFARKKHACMNYRDHLLINDLQADCP